MLSRRLPIFALLVAMLFTGVPAVAHADDAAAREFVNSLTSQAIETMTGKSVPDADRNGRFRDLFIGSADMPVIGKYVLARYWKVATPEEQQEFLKLFEDMLVLTWSGRFKEATGNISVAIDDVKPDVEDTVQVESRILREAHDPSPVIWRLHPVDGKLKILDLVIEGTSMSLTYRQEYSSVISQRGGKVSGLLDALRQKIAQMQQPAANKATN